MAICYGWVHFFITLHYIPILRLSVGVTLKLLSLLGRACIGCRCPWRRRKIFSGCNLLWILTLFVIWHFAVDRGLKWQLNFKAKTKIAYILETKRRRAKIAIICDHFNPCWQSNKYIEAARGHIETMFSKKSANGKCQQTNGHGSF